MKELRKQLKNMKHIEGLVNPDRVWVKENKNRLMRQISNTTEKTPTSRVYLFKQAIKTFIPPSFISYARPAFTTFAVLIVAIAGWAASVSASFNSLPGDVLWNVKIAAEKTQIAFSGSETKIKKKLEFAERRVEEVKLVLELEDDTQKTPKRVKAAKREIKKVKDSVKKVVEDANKSVKNKAKKDPNAAVEFALAVESKTSEIAEDIKELKTVVEKDGDVDFKKEVADAAVETKDSAFNSAKSVLDLSSESEVAENEQVQEEIKQLVEELVEGKLEDVLEDNVDVQIKVGEEVQEEIIEVSTTSTGIVEEMTTVSSSLIFEEEKEKVIPEVVEVSEETKTEVKEKTNEVEQSEQEVRELIEEGRLDEALDKIQDLDKLTNDAEEIISKNTEPVEEPLVDQDTETRSDEIQVVEETRSDESTDVVPEADRTTDTETRTE